MTVRGPAREQEKAMKRKVLQIIYPYDPFGAKIGGAETFVKEMIRHAPADFDIEYVGVTSRKQVQTGRWHDRQMDGKPVKYHPVLYVKDENRKTRVPLSLRFSFKLLTSRIESRGKICFFNRIEPALFYAKSARSRVAIVHNDIQQHLDKKQSELHWSRFPLLYEVVEKMVFRTMHRIYTTSRNTLDLYRRRYGDREKNLSFIPVFYNALECKVSGTPKGTLKRDVCSALKLPRDAAGKKWVLFVGRLQKQKAPGRVVDAFAALLEKRNDVRLIVVGDGNERAFLQSYAREKKVDHKMVLVGRWPTEHISEIYQAGDVLLITSHFEAGPIVALEALACGLPVVSTAVGEISRIITVPACGEVVATYDPATMAQALENVLSRTRHNPLGCAKAAEKYAPQAVLSRLFTDMERMHGNVE